MDELKQRFLDDLATRAELAKALGKTERTIRRWRLPTVRFGNTTYVVISKAREQILGSGVLKTRGPGRPRKNA